MKKALSVLAVAAATTLALASCSSSASAPGGGSTAWPDQSTSLKGVTLTMWNAAASATIPGKVVAGFEKLTGAKVNLVTIPDPYEQSVLTKIATGDKPDVAFWQPSNSELTVINAKANLQPLDGAPWLKKVDPALRDAAGIVDGTRYAALISTPAVVGMYYNKADFAKAGITTTPSSIPEMITDAKKLKAAGITPFYDAAKDQWPTQWFTQSLLANASKAGYYKDVNTQKAKFTDPTFTDAVSEYKSWIDAGLFNADIKSGTFVDQGKTLLSGDTAMVDQITAYSGELLSQAGSASSLDSKIGYFGISPTGNLSLAIPDQTNGLVAFKTGDAKKEAAARQFLSYWMGAGYKSFIDSQSYVSIEPSVATSSSVPTLFKDVAAGFKNSVPGMQPSVLATPDIHIYLSNMINGTMTVAQVGQAMQTQFVQLAKAEGAKGF
ncbi:MAG: carbohydrate ABC transporter substrate-binding protein [Microbacteriaceae bacterium]|nr:MAG: carbohydrate ABC transporter substrate-binding protein [Microbacteriaceae bacterium]